LKRLSFPILPLFPSPKLSAKRAGYTPQKWLSFSPPHYRSKRSFVLPLFPALLISSVVTSVPPPDQHPYPSFFNPRPIPRSNGFLPLPPLSPFLPISRRTSLSAPSNRRTYKISPFFPSPFFFSSLSVVEHFPSFESRSGSHLTPLFSFKPGIRGTPFLLPVFFFPPHHLGEKACRLMSLGPSLPERDLESPLSPFSHGVGRLSEKQKDRSPYLLLLPTLLGPDRLFPGASSPG